MIVKSQIVNIDPTTAANMLSKNYVCNRPLNDSWVVALADMMRCGKFNSLNGQNRIIIDTDGVLYDGQHRLKAIIASGVTLPFEVCVSDSAERDYSTFDYGKVKSAKDFIPNPQRASRSAIATLAYAFKYGQLSLLSTVNSKKLRYANIDKKSVVILPDRLSVARFHNDNPDYFLWLAQKAGLIRRRSGGGSLSTIGSVLYFLKYVGVEDSKISEFVDEATYEFPRSRAVMRFHDNVKTALLKKDYKPNDVFYFREFLAAFVGFVNDSVLNSKQKDKMIESYDNALKAARERDEDRNDG